MTTPHEYNFGGCKLKFPAKAYPSQVDANSSFTLLSALLIPISTWTGGYDVQNCDEHTKKSKFVARISDWLREVISAFVWSFGMAGKSLSRKNNSNA